MVVSNEIALLLLTQKFVGHIMQVSITKKTKLWKMAYFNMPEKKRGLLI